MKEQGLSTWGEGEVGAPPKPQLISYSSIYHFSQNCVPLIHTVLTNQRKRYPLILGQRKLLCQVCNLDNY